MPGAGMTATMNVECPHQIERPVMRQEWRDLLFVSGRVDADVIRNLLPAGVEVDEFDGSGWISYVPFTMRDVAFGPLPPVPYLGTFPEVNIRTYVRHEGVPYVWFFSLDVNRLLPAVVARLTYRLPYCWGRASNILDGNRLVTEVRRRWPAGDAAARRAADALLQDERAAADEDHRQGQRDLEVAVPGRDETGDEQQRVAGQEEADEQAGLGEDDEEQNPVDPRAVFAREVMQVILQMQEEIEDLLEGVHARGTLRNRRPRGKCRLRFNRRDTPPAPCRFRPRLLP